MKDFITARGFIDVHIRWKNGNTFTVRYNNHIIDSGRNFLAGSLLKETGPYIVNMLFGDGGTQDGVPKEINPAQDKMNGVVRLRKPVIAQLDPEMPNQVIFTVVLGENEGNDFTINEMALEMSDERLFNLSTFPNLNKTNEMEITYCWCVCFI